MPKRGKLTVTFLLEEYHDDDPSYVRKSFGTPTVFDGVKVDPAGRAEINRLYADTVDVFVKAGLERVKDSNPSQS